MKAILLTLLLSGCAVGSPTGLILAETYGDIRLDTASAPDHDYRLFVKNSLGFEFDGAIPADRLRIATLYLSTQCETSRLVREVPIKTGQYAFRPAITYVMEMACNR